MLKTALPTRLALVGIIILALALGALTPFYTDFMNGEVGKMAALPAVLGLGILLLYSRKQMLIGIMIARASGDVFFESTKFNIGGYQLGIGGLINAFVILIAVLLVSEKPAVLPPRALKIWLPFLAVATFGIVFAPAKADAIRAWLSLVSSFAIFCSAFYLVQSAEDFRKCMRLIVISSVLPVCYAFYLLASGNLMPGPEGLRMQSTFGHPNIFAFYLTIVISLAFYLQKSQPATGAEGNRIVLIAYLFILIGMLFLTKTRNAWLTCFISILVYAFMFQRRYFLYLLFIPVVGVLVPGVADRITDLGHGNEVATYASLNSFAWRVYLWESAFHWTAPAQYALGHGLQSFKEYSPIFFPMAGGVNWGAHSVYVQDLFEIGVVGTAAYLWIYYKVLRYLQPIYRVDRLGAATLMAIVAAYVISSAGDNMLDYLSFSWYLWFCVGAGCAYARLIENTRGLAATRSAPASPAPRGAGPATYASFERGVRDNHAS